MQQFEFAKELFEIVVFLGGVIFAVMKIVAKTEMLGQIIERLASEVGHLRESIQEVTESHADHNIRIVRLETVLGQKNGNHRN